MKFLDFVIVILLFALLATGVYLLWLNFPVEPTEFDEYVANLSLELPNESVQFYSNMRYADGEISYFISKNCSTKKTNDFIDAVVFLEHETVLDFYPSDKPDILVTCSNIALSADEAGHFVAGEGGPSVIINATNYAVILLGKIALYRPESCDSPQVATHELLHALGFDHNNNKNSIMFPVTSCDQTFDRGIVNEINRLYGVPSAADLVVENVKANKTRRYLNFDIVVANYGLKSVADSNLRVESGGKLIREFDLGDLDLGAKKTLTITNLKVPSDAEEFSFIVETDEEEISKTNNVARIGV
jgi:hypothetical protein